MNAVALSRVKNELFEHTRSKKNTDVVSDVKRKQAGNLEGIVGHKLSGWVFDSTCDESVTYQIFKDNMMIIEGKAQINRPDLIEAGYIKGGFGFEADIPACLIDGAQHRLTLRVLNSDHILSSHDIKIPPFARSWVDKIEGGILTGTVELSQPDNADGFDVELLVDGIPVLTTDSRRSNESTKYSLNVDIPSEYFDDNRHIFTVRIKGLHTVTEPFIDCLPSISTPWEYLCDSAVNHKLSGLSKISVFRYESLQRHLDKPGSENLDFHELSNVKKAHDVLVQGYENRREFPRLVLPLVKKPKVSIVIPVHNNAALTYHCIASIILASDRPGFEVIVVDDQSSDETVHINDFIENLEYVRNDVNLGFLYSSRKGAESAKGDYLVFLNNDTEVTSGWLDEMLMAFEKFDQVGAVGSKLIYPNGKLQEAGGIVWGNGKPWNIGNGGNAEHPSFNYVRQVDYLSGASLMVKRNVWDETDGFSTEMAPAYYEDTDLAFKIRERGYKTIYCPFSIVVHFEGMSNGCDVNTGVKQFQHRNAPKFRSKWRHAYKNNGAEGKELNKHIDREVDFRALVIDYAIPRPDHDAGSYAAVQEMTILQEIGCKVTFIPNNLAYIGKYTQQLQKQGVECIYAPFYTSVEDFVSQRIEDYDFVYITRYDIAESIIPTIRKKSNIKIILNNADLHFLRELRAAMNLPEKSLNGPLDTRDRELKVMRDVDAVLSYNETEHAVIASHILNETNVFKCPWVLHDRRSGIPFENRSGIAFLGGFGHPPNIEAVEYLATQIMPLLYQKDPRIKLYVYGSRITDEVKNLGSENIVIRGYVESLSDIFDKHRILAAPLLSGAGIKGKVLDSISHGVPTVLSSIAVEATGLSHGFSTMVADNPRDWCSYLVKLHTDSAFWNQTAQNAFKLVEEEYSQEKGIERLGKALSYVELEPANLRTKLFKSN